MVASAAGPSVLGDDDIAAAHVYHRLDAYAHAVTYHRPGASASIVGHLGVFVHVSAYTVTAHLAHDAVSAAFAVGLHGVADVSYAVTGTARFDAYVQRLLGSTTQGQNLGINLAHGEGVARVAHETIFGYHQVGAYDVAFAQGVGRRNP